MHPSDGALRRALDEPASLADANRRHVAGCVRCQQVMERASADRDYAHALLTLDSTPDDTDLATQWGRLSDAVAVPSQPLAEAMPTRLRRRRFHRATVLTAAGAVLVIGGATAAAANDWLPVFHTESVAPVSVPASMSDVTNLAAIAGLSDLSRYGRWQSQTTPTLQAVPDAATAEQRTGLTVTPVADLPIGVTGEPIFHVVEQQSAVFQFSSEKARRTVTQAGDTLPALPKELDGAVLRVQAGPAVVRLWKQDSGIPTLVIAEIGTPVAQSSGVPLDVLREALLSLPGMPPALAAQLRAVTSDGTTLPIPVPADQFSTSATTVGGAPATLLESRDGTMSGVVWVSGGVVHVVAGPLSSSEVESVASELS
jgi:hypothetical protein